MQLFTDEARPHVCGTAPVGQSDMKSFPAEG